MRRREEEQFDRRVKRLLNEVIAERGEGVSTKPVEVAKEKKKYGIISVSVGEGLNQMFKDLRVDEIVSGGQTMNPSIEDFVKAISKLNPESVIILPNNSNIVLTAQQAAKYYDKANVVVVNSKSLAQGYSALTMLDLSSDDIETIMEETKEVISNVTTGLVTYAIRDAEIDDVVIKNGDFFAISDFIFYYKNGIIWTEIRDGLNINCLPFADYSNPNNYPKFSRNTRVRTVLNKDKIEVTKAAT